MRVSIKQDFVSKRFMQQWSSEVNICGVEIQNA